MNYKREDADMTATISEATIGVDASASAIKLAKSLAVTPSAEMQYVHFDIEQDDIQELPEPSYALITCKSVYAFIKDKPAFLRKVRTLLAPSGVFGVSTWHVDDVPVERRAIAVGDGEFELLSSNFKTLARYKGDEPDMTPTYFVGQ